jgi:hypothetical protein
VKAKLQRLNAALDAAAAKHDAKSLEPLYGDYLELRSAARTGATPDECERLLQRTRALLDRVERKQW